MQRLLKDVEYRLLVGDKQFTKIVQVYSYPRKDSILEYKGFDFIITQERQSLEIYMGQDYKAGKTAEIITAVPYDRNQNLKIQTAFRSDDRNGIWKETDHTSFVMVIHTPLFPHLWKWITGVIFMATVLGAILAPNHVWYVVMAVALLWALRELKK
jgi:hypothetical protein